MMITAKILGSDLEHQILQFVSDDFKVSAIYLTNNNKIDVIDIRCLKDVKIKDGE